MSFVVDTQPLQVVGGASPDGGPLLGLVRSATRLHDGTLVIADNSAGGLRFFDRQGRPTRTVGREGDGPGEFRMLGTVRQCSGDSLFATDARGVLVFSSGGAFVRQFRLPRFAPLVACSPAGVLVLVNCAAEEEVRVSEDVRRRREPIVLANTAGEVVHQLEAVSFGEIHRSGGAWLARPGSAYATVGIGGESVAICPPDSGAVGVWSVGGQRRRSIPLGATPRVPSRAHVDAFLDRYLAAIPVALRDRFRERYRLVPPAERLPPCSGVLVDPHENVWVVRSYPGDTTTTLRVFGPDDRLLGDVTVPAELDVLEIGSDYLLGSGQSADGEPWVRVYRVRGTASR